jgi:hypothetical protein
MLTDFGLGSQIELDSSCGGGGEVRVRKRKRRGGGKGYLDHEKIGNESVGRAPAKLLKIWRQAVLVLLQEPRHIVGHLPSVVNHNEALLDILVDLRLGSLQGAVRLVLLEYFAEETFIRTFGDTDLLIDHRKDPRDLELQEVQSRLVIFKLNGV